VMAAHSRRCEQLAKSKRAGFGLIQCNRVGCGKTFTKKRRKQRYCSTSCQVRDAMARHRNRQEPITSSPPVLSTTEPITRPPAPLLGPQKAFQSASYGFGKRGDAPLQGDDYPLEYYEDGFPKLPACLDRRKYDRTVAA
jgi:hypothetical protein